ncbi:MAG: NAD(P)/FAD-dependent oxidoreductase [Candidatus Micrarchaeia archaeon]
MKVSVIGAGPSGCIAAASAAIESHCVVVYEEHRKIGFPVQCGGLLSRTAINWFGGLGVDCKSTIINTISGWRIFCGKTQLSIRSNEPKAYVVRRHAFDQACADFAERNGAKIEMNARLGPREIKKLSTSSFVIGADGPFSTVAETFSFPPIKKYAVAYQSDVTDLSLGSEKNIVKVYLYGKSFGWLIPLNEERARAGMLFFSDPRVRIYNHFLDILGKETGKNLMTRGMFSDCIPVSIRPRIQVGKICLVGDAAGQVKPTSGGGVYYGCKSAWLAGKTLDSGDYEKRWRKEIGKDLGSHIVIRKLANALNRKSIELILRLAPLFGIDRMFARYDMEKISSIFGFN